MPLLSDAEYSKLESWGCGAQPELPPKAVWQRFSTHAKARPHALAIDDGTCQLSYAELDAWSNRIGRRLKAAGVGRGDLVAVAMERSAQMLAGMLGAWKAGSAFMPLDVGHPAQWLQFVFDDAGAVALLERGETRLPIDTAKQIRINVDQLGDEPSSLSEHAVPDTDVAYVLYTSGSSGQPKGVEVPHGALANLIDWFGRRLGLSSTDRCSQLAGAGFDASMMEWWGALGHGASVHVVAEATRSSPSVLIGWLHEQSIDVAFIPTPLAQVVLTLSWPSGIALRAIYVGGDKLQQPCPHGLPFSLYDAYGPTEATVVTTFAEVVPVEPGLPGAGIGHPIDGVHVRVLDAHGRRVPVGTAGELYIGGAGLARGYRSHPELTAAAFVEIPGEPPQRLYRSGDRVRYRNDGVLEFIGRVDDQVKLRGLRIELGEVRAALQNQASVAVASVVVRGEGEGRFLQACVEAAPGYAPTAQSLRDALSERLPSYMVPFSILVLDAIPYTRNGKLDLEALPGGRHGPPLPAQDVGTDAAPTAGIELALAVVWAELLEIDVACIGRHADLFALGGHSLLLVRMTVSIRSVFGVDMTYRQLFDALRLDVMAARIRDAGVESGDSGSEELEEVQW
jgi:amino acid adenylation domain-containing protein